MSDRLALANAIEDAGIERGKAERIASVIFDAIHNNVATKADVQASEAAIRGTLQALRGDLQSSEAGLRRDLLFMEARLDAKVTAVHADLTLVEPRLLTRLGGLMVVLAGLLLAALRYWPPHG